MEQDITEDEVQDASEEEINEKMALEPEIDFSNPDASPLRYNKFVGEQTIKVDQIAEEIMEKYIRNSDIPFAFLEILPQNLIGKIKIIKGKAKLFEKANRISNLAHLTPVKDLELYESVEESKEKIEDLDS